jgi:hypothetical protein
MIKRLAYFLLPLNVLIDTLLLFSEQLSWLPLLRAFLLLALIMYTLAHFSAKRNQYAFILVFVLYCLAQLFFVTNFAKSAIITLKVCIPIASFIVGFRLFNNPEEIRKLSVSIIWVYFILIVNFVLSQFFKLGESVYSEESDFRVGNLDDAWNVFTYSVLLAPMVLHFAGTDRLKSGLTYVGSVLNALLVVISIKRIAIIGLVTGTLMHWYNAYPLKRMIRYGVIALAGAALAYPFIQDIIEKRIEARSNRFETGALEREGRYLESEYVWSEALSFDHPTKSLFGLEGFYSVGNYANGNFGDRQLHVDYNLIVNTIGLVGLMLYLWIFVQMARRMHRVKDHTELPQRSKTMLISTFWMLLLNQFITSFAGQMYHVSYRLIVFVFLGAILGTCYNSAYARTHRLQR